MAARQSKSSKRKTPTGPAWDRLELAPVVLLVVGEPILGDRAVQRLLDLARQRDGETAITRIDAETYAPGRISTLTSPSLFGEPRLLVATRLNKMNDAFLSEALAYVSDPQDDVVLIARHEGGNRGKKLLDAIVAAGYQRCDIPAVKSDADKAELVRADAARAGRKMTRGAVEALVDALGRDTGELLAATSQLLADVEGAIDETAVRTYYAGRIEATQFAVADAAIAGQAGQAIALARHALATGTAAVPIVAALAAKLRQLATVLGQRSKTPREGDPTMAPWQRERAQRALRSWTSEGLARAILAVAQADAEVKGASRDPEFALERAILRVAAACGRD
ncbi:MAG: DNA polymerase III subunit delta [Actinomycetaceae bacterium]|nr:DNA polymerase III subunit delta [Actinomycetaceae bacterium]